MTGRTVARDHPVDVADGNDGTDCEAALVGALKAAARPRNYGRDDGVDPACCHVDGEV